MTMTSATWPSTLPQELRLADMQESLPSAVVATDMDAGPPKVRRRFTAAPRPVTGSMVMTRSQVRILDDFFTNVLAMGSLPFSWWFPRTKRACSFIFKPNSPPRVRPLAPRDRSGTEYWIVEIELQTVGVFGDYAGGTGLPGTGLGSGDDLP